ncbi:hypothetical protein FACS189479_05640 [Spirochaetia bacterium]|nr:hypothetical protein FACS189479_05640 [Spirochaetia bacterium]
MNKSRTFDRHMIEVDFYEGEGWLDIMCKKGESTSCKVFEMNQRAEAKAYCEKMNKAIGFVKPPKMEAPMAYRLMAI